MTTLKNSVIGTVSLVALMGVAGAAGRGGGDRRGGQHQARAFSRRRRDKWHR